MAAPDYGGPSPIEPSCKLTWARNGHVALVCRSQSGPSCGSVDWCHNTLKVARTLTTNAVESHQRNFDTIYAETLAASSHDKTNTKQTYSMHTCTTCVLSLLQVFIIVWTGYNVSRSVAVMCWFRLLSSQIGSAGNQLSWCRCVSSLAWSRP